MTQGKCGISFTEFRALLTFQLDAMVRARNAYQNWHATVHGDVTKLLPLRQENFRISEHPATKRPYGHV